MKPQDEKGEAYCFTFKPPAETHPAKISFTLKYFCVIKCRKLSLSKLLSYVMHFKVPASPLYLVEGLSQYTMLLG